MRVLLVAALLVSACGSSVTPATPAGTLTPSAATPFPATPTPAPTPEATATPQPTSAPVSLRDYIGTLSAAAKRAGKWPSVTTSQVTKALESALAADPYAAGRFSPDLLGTPRANKTLAVLVPASWTMCHSGKSVALWADRWNGCMETVAFLYRGYLANQETRFLDAIALVIDYVAQNRANPATLGGDSEFRALLNILTDEL